MALVIRSASGLALCLACLASQVPPGAEAMRCEGEKEVFEAIFDLLKGTFKKEDRGEELSLEDWSMRRLYYGSYKKYCSQLHLALQESTEMFERVARSLMRQVIGLGETLDESNKKFIHTSIELISLDLFSGMSVYSGLSAGAVALARQMVERPEVREGVRLALVKARDGQLLVKQYQKLTGVFTSLLPGHLNLAAKVIKRAPLIDPELVANPMEVRKWASRADVVLQGTIVAYESLIDFDQWANGELSGERVTIKLTARLAGWAAAGLCAATGSDLGEHLGQVIDKVTSLDGVGAAVGATVGGVLAGLSCHYFANEGTQALLANYFNVPFDQQTEEAYRALGVKPSASNSEVNKAFQHKVEQFNPEKEKQFETEVAPFNLHMEAIRASRNKEARALMSGLAAKSAKSVQSEL